VQARVAKGLNFRHHHSRTLAILKKLMHNVLNEKKKKKFGHNVKNDTLCCYGPLLEMAVYLNWKHTN